MTSPTRPDTSKGAKHLVESSPCLRSIPGDCVLPAEVLSEPVEFRSVPVIDAGGLEDRTRRGPIVEEIKLACEEWGFFIAINHGFDRLLMESMLQTVKSFFALPVEEKMAHSFSDATCFVLYGSNLNADVGANAHHWSDYLRHYSRPSEKDSLHLWPTNPPPYRHVTKAYVDEVWRLAMKLAGAISESLGLNSGYIEGAFGEGSQIIACNYYPECPQPDRTLGLSSHTDRGGLTIVMENGVEGLQVRHKGKWVPVPHVPGSFLVNIGDCIEIMSNGRYRSVEHRAVVNENRARISVAVGNGPGYDITVEPATHLLNKAANGPDYKPILFKELRFKERAALGNGARNRVKKLANLSNY